MASPTTARNWKKQIGEELQLPSGNVCLVKRPGMEKLFEAGILPDNLTQIAIEAIETAQTGKPQDHKKPAAEEDIDPELMKKFLSEEGALNDIFSSFDRVAAMCVINPVVKWHMRPELDEQGNRRVDTRDRVVYEEIPEEDRDEDTLYTDEIDADDKTFIFNFVVGGTRDLETFRQEYGNALATVSTSEDVEVSSERIGKHSL